MRALRLYSNWEILLDAARHPRTYWQIWRNGEPILNGWWFRNPRRIG